MFELFLDLHLAQFVGIGLAHLLAGCILNGLALGFFSRLALNQGLATLLWVLFGILTLLAGASSSLVCLALCAGVFALAWRNFKSWLLAPARFSIFFSFYLRFVLLPFCFFLFFACMFLSQFKPTEISPYLDQWETARRVGVYIVPDHVLQWQISRNFVAGEPLETGFRRKKVQIWSAGDRPILLGFLDASLTKFSGKSGETIYFLRIIYLASFAILLILGWLRVEFKISKTSAWILACGSILTAPFLFTNVIYTWPKFAGLGFAFGGIHLLRTLLQVKRENEFVFLWAMVGVLFALGTLCHAAAIYGAIAGVVYFSLTRWACFRELGLKALMIRAGIAALAFLILVATHKAYLSSHTRPTGLLARVQFCRGGSFAHPTKIISLWEACRRYYKQQGLRGIAADRMRSLHSGFLWGYEFVWTHARDILKGTISHHYLRQEWDKWAQMLPLFSVGFASLGLGFIMFALGGFRPTPAVVSMAIGFTLLFLFACTLAQFEEMRSHVVPFAIPIFIWLGLLAALYQVWAPALYLYCGVSMVWQVAVLAERSSWMTAWQNPPAIAAGIFFLFTSLWLVLRFDSDLKIERGHAA